MGAGGRDANQLNTEMSRAVTQREVSPIHNYRHTMVHHLGEAIQMIQRSLSGADFDKPFPYIFGDSTGDGGELAIRSELGLLLRKAQLHTSACLRANASNNLHSFSVQMRVVLECAAPVVMKANAAAEGPSQLRRMLNFTEYDAKDVFQRIGRGSIDPDRIQETIIEARRGIGQYWEGPPKRRTVADKINSLPGGHGWYDHLSRSFCDSSIETLSGPFSRGGVISRSAAEIDIAFALSLEQLTHRVLLMLLGQGFLLIAVGGGSKAFDDALDLHERATAAVRQAQPIGWPSKADSWPGTED